MAETSEQIDAMFPALGDAELVRLRSFGHERHAKAGEILFDVGDADHGIFVVLDGSIEVIGVSNSAAGKTEESVLRVLGRGTFTGEVNQLSGRRSLIRCRAREDSSVLEIARIDLQHLLQTDPVFGEMFLRVFLD